MPVRSRDAAPQPTSESDSAGAWTLQREIVVATPAAIDLARAVMESVASGSADDGRHGILGAIVHVLESETLGALREGTVDGLGHRHRRLWRAIVEVAHDLLGSGGSDAAVEPAGSAWARLAEETERCLPALPLDARLETRAAARLMSVSGAESVEQPIGREDEQALRVHGLLQALSVLARQPGGPGDAAYAVARGLGAAAVSIAADRADEARLWAEKREAEIRFAANLKALSEARPDLMKQHAGEWVIVADGVVVGLAPDFQVAGQEAFRLYPDGRALVMPVDEDRELREPDPEKWGLGGGEGKA